jgi:replicative DNA helicase
MDLPYDVSAERGIICTLIMYPQFIFEVSTLKDSHFYDKQNGVLYWAIQELVNKGIMKFDESNLLIQINTDAEKSKVIGKDIEDQLCELVDNSALLARSSEQEYKALVNRVIGLGFKRELYQEIKKIENKCLTDSTNDISKINADINKTIDGLAVKYITGNNIVNFGDKLEKLWNRLVENRNGDGTVGYPTAWGSLDQFITYRKGELTVIEAQRKHGKSVVGMNETFHLLKCGLAVVYFDTEMKDDIFFSRLISHMTGIPEKNVLSGGYTEEEENVIFNAMKWIKDRQLIHEYDPSWTKERVITECKILKNQGRLDFFIYDYIKDTSGKTSMGEVYLELGHWCNDIKNKICGALDIPGLTFAQLNRQGQTGDSFKIEQYVTTGITWRPKTEEELARDGKECGNYCMIINFNRIGDSHSDGDYIDFVFKKPTLTIEEAAQQHKRENTPFE